MEDRKILEKKLRKALEDCILLSVEDKRSFLQKIADMPDSFLKKAIEMVEAKNKKVKGYLDAGLALDEEQNYLQTINSQAKKDQMEAKAIYEKSSSDEVDQDLQNQLKIFHE